MPTATVLSIDEQGVTVSVDAALGCARCAAGKGCGAALLGGRRRPRVLTLERPPGMDLHEGDRVDLTLAPERLLQASLLAYGLPLAALVLLPLAAETLWGPYGDGELALLAAGGLVGAIVAGRRLLARDRCPAQLKPAIGGRAAADAVER